MLSSASGNKVIEAFGGDLEAIARHTCTRARFLLAAHREAREAEEGGRMRRKAIMDAALWIVTAVCLILSMVYFFKWKAAPNPTDEGHVSQWVWITLVIIAMVCILIWFFTRGKEEEISITRG